MTESKKTPSRVMDGPRGKRGGRERLRCGVVGCRNGRKPGQLACVQHWYMIPWAVRGALEAEFSRNPESREYRRWVKVAKEWLRTFEEAAGTFTDSEQG